MPKIGYRFDTVSLWVGEQYQKTRHSQPGDFTTNMFGPNVSIPFNAEVEDKELWGAHRRGAMEHHAKLESYGGRWRGCQPQAIAIRHDLPVLIPIPIIMRLNRVGF